MHKTLTCSIFLLVACTAVQAQVVHTETRAGSSDPWLSLYKAGKKITFSGKVTGIEVVRPNSGKESEVTLLVKNSNGGGTSIVDLGPRWFVDHQEARIHLKDKVQVTGSKAIVDGHGIVLASLIRVNGQGGPVVTLRRPNGRAYWVGTEQVTADNVPKGENVLSGQISDVGTYSVNNQTYSEATLQTANGLVTVDLGPAWYYTQQDVRYNVGDNISVVVGGQPFTVGPNNSVWQSRSIYNGSNVYSIRNVSGTPLYLW